MEISLPKYLLPNICPISTQDYQVAPKELDLSKYSNAINSMLRWS